MTHNIYIYILIMAAVSYAIRVLPLTLIRKPLENQFLQSFLYYVPYVTLAVMTFPAIIHATQSPIAGALALDHRHRSCLDGRGTAARSGRLLRGSFCGGILFRLY